MSDTIIFDTLIYAKKLKSAGFTEEQAEIQAETMASIIDEKLATKRDLKEMDVNLRRDMKEMEANLRRDMKEIEVNLRHDMKEMEMRLTIRMGAIQAAAIAIIAALVKLL